MRGRDGAGAHRLPVQAGENGPTVTQTLEKPRGLGRSRRLEVLGHPVVLLDDLVHVPCDVLERVFGSEFAGGELGLKFGRGHRGLPGLASADAHRPCGVREAS